MFKAWRRPVPDANLNDRCFLGCACVADLTSFFSFDGRQLDLSFVYFTGTERERGRSCDTPRIRELELRRARQTYIIGHGKEKEEERRKEVARIPFGDTFQNTVRFAVLDRIHSSCPRRRPDPGPTHRHNTPGRQNYRRKHDRLPKLDRELLVRPSGWRDRSRPCHHRPLF